MLVSLYISTFNQPSSSKNAKVYFAFKAHVENHETSIICLYLYQLRTNQNCCYIPHLKQSLWNLCPCTGVGAWDRHNLHTRYGPIRMVVTYHIWSRAYGICVPAQEWVLPQPSTHSSYISGTLILRRTTSCNNSEKENYFMIILMTF